MAWHVEDNLWNNVVIDYYKDRILCLECFLRMADNRGIVIRLADIDFTGLVFCREHYAGERPMGLNSHRNSPNVA